MDGFDQMAWASETKTVGVAAASHVLQMLALPVAQRLADAVAQRLAFEALTR